MFQGFFIITLLIPHMRQQSKAWVSGLSGLGVAGALYLLIITSTVAVFGAEEVKELLYPTLELAKQRICRLILWNGWMPRLSLYG